MDTKKMSERSLITNGVISFLVGVTLFFLTGLSQSTFVLILAAYAMILGLSQILAANGERDEGKTPAYLLGLGFYSLVAGIVLLFFANASLSTVITLVGAYVVITGLAEIVAGFAYRSEMGGYAWLVGSGVFRSLFGIFLLLNSGIALSTFILYVAIYAIVEGVIFGIFGYEVGEQRGKYHQNRITQ